MPLPELPTLDGVRHSNITVNGVSIHLAEAGARDGDAIVMQHGWPQNWWCWHKLIPTFAGAGFRVICPDLRGHGWSGAPPGGYDKHQLAHDLIGVMDALGLERVKLVGHDWGAMAGYLACIESPERFERFLALGIVPPFPSTNPRAPLHFWRFYYQFLIASGLPEPLFRKRPAVIRRAIASGAAREGAFDRADLDVYARALQDPGHARASVLLYRTFVTREMARLVTGRWAGPLRVPTRLMLGDKDPVCRMALVDGYEKFADDMQVEVLENCGHFLPEEAPAEVSQRALAFFG